MKRLPFQTLAFYVTGLLFEAVVLAVAFHTMTLFGGRIFLVGIILLMVLAAARGVRGFADHLYGPRPDRPPHYVPARDVPRDTTEKVPALIIIVMFTLMAFVALTVLAAPGVAIERALAEGGDASPGTVVGVRSHSERLHVVGTVFQPPGAAEPEPPGFTMLLGPAHRLPEDGAPVLVRHAPGARPSGPSFSRMETPEGMQPFPYQLVAIELGVLVFLGWLYGAAVLLQRSVAPPGTFEPKALAAEASTPGS